MLACLSGCVLPFKPERPLTHVEAEEEPDGDLGEAEHEVLVDVTDVLPHAGVEQLEEDDLVGDEDHAEAHRVRQGGVRPAETGRQRAENVPGGYTFVRKGDI